MKEHKEDRPDLDQLEEIKSKLVKTDNLSKITAIAATIEDLLANYPNAARAEETFVYFFKDTPLNLAEVWDKIDKNNVTEELIKEIIAYQKPTMYPSNEYFVLELGEDTHTIRAFRDTEEIGNTQIENSYESKSRKKKRTILISEAVATLVEENNIQLSPNKTFDKSTVGGNLEVSRLLALTLLLKTYEKSDLSSLIEELGLVAADIDWKAIHQVLTELLTVENIKALEETGFIKKFQGKEQFYTTLFTWIRIAALQEVSERKSSTVNYSPFPFGNMSGHGTREKDKEQLDKKIFIDLEYLPLLLESYINFLRELPYVLQTEFNATGLFRIIFDLNGIDNKGNNGNHGKGSIIIKAVERFIQTHLGEEVTNATSVLDFNSIMDKVKELGAKNEEQHKKLIDLVNIILKKLETVQKLTDFLQKNPPLLHPKLRPDVKNIEDLDKRKDFEKYQKIE